MSNTISFQLLINPSVPCMNDCMLRLVPINVTWRTHSTSKPGPALNVAEARVNAITRGLRKRPVMLAGPLRFHHRRAGMETGLTNIMVKSKTLLEVMQKTCANDTIFSPTMSGFDFTNVCFELFWFTSFSFAWFVYFKSPHFAIHVVWGGRRVVNIFDCRGDLYVYGK